MGIVEEKINLYKAQCQGVAASKWKEEISFKNNYIV